MYTDEEFNQQILVLGECFVCWFMQAV